MKKTISVLLPARGRATHLKPCIASIFDLADSPDDVEVLVRLDDDDPQFDAECTVLRAYPPSRVKCFKGPRLGYRGMHVYYNDLADRSAGRWLFFWNDDMVMLTPGWDRLTCEAPEFSVQFPRRDTTKTTDYTLPVVGRPIFEALGHLSLNAYADAWLSDVSGFAGTSIIRDDIVFMHHRLNDQTLREQSNGGPDEWKKFKGEIQTTLRHADMERLLTAPEYESRFAGWSVEFVEHVGVEHINLCSFYAKAHAYRLTGRRV